MKNTSNNTNSNVKKEENGVIFIMTTTVENYKKTYGLVMDSPDQISSMRQIDEIANDIFVSGLSEPEETSQSISLKEVLNIACSCYNISPIFAREAITMLLRDPEVRQTKLVTTISYLSSSAAVDNSVTNDSCNSTKTIIDSSGSVAIKTTVLDYRLSKKKSTIGS